MSKHKQYEGEAERFLDILEGQVRDMMAYAEIRMPDGDINFEIYNKFRDMMAECLSFLIIIDHRIAQAGEAKRETLKEQLDKLTVALWSVLLDGSLGFLELIAQHEFLPIGTRYIFINELATLHQARNILTYPESKRMLSEETSSRLATAEKILTLIIERAPSLLQLG
jgi:hypothetical protein